MFPESHSHAFAVTAYQAAWLKRRHPLEFFVSLVNNQPMGFYPVETLKQDARRFGVPFLNPCVNRSGVGCIPDGDSVLLGLRFVKDVGEASAKLVVEERDRHGPYAGAGDLVRRTGLKPQGGGVPGDGRGLRFHHPQPPQSPVGRGLGHTAVERRAAGLPLPRWKRGPSAWPTSPATRGWPGSTGPWASIPGGI